jgi:hypothetical protein
VLGKIIDLKNCDGVLLPDGWTAEYVKDKKSKHEFGVFFTEDGHIFDDKHRVRGSIYVLKNGEKQTALFSRLGVHIMHDGAGRAEYYFGEQFHRNKQFARLFVAGTVREPARDTNIDGDEYFSYDFFEQCKDLVRKCEDWGDFHYPKWRDLDAYWDEPKIDKTATQKTKFKTIRKSEILRSKIREI